MVSVMGKRRKKGKEIANEVREGGGETRKQFQFEEQSAAPLNPQHVLVPVRTPPKQVRSTSLYKNVSTSRPTYAIHLPSPGQKHVSESPLLALAKG